MKFEIPRYPLEGFLNLKEIGCGSGGIVSKRFHPDFGQVAVKEFSWKTENQLEDYKKEIEILSEHRHPNIVRLYGILCNMYGKKKGKEIENILVFFGYVMEFLEEGSLHDVIYDPEKNYNTAQIYRWINQIGLGLQYLHNRKIMHRDIKPQNILIAGEQLKLADFGTSRTVATNLTGGVGTFNYMAPEVIDTNGLAADIYSLAITIWEIFHREKPYELAAEMTLYSHLQQIKTGKRPALDTRGYWKFLTISYWTSPSTRKMDKDTANFVQRCWQKDPDSRPPIQDCVEFFRAKVDATRPLEEEANFIRRQVNDETILVLGGGGSGNNAKKILVLKENQWIKLSLKLPKRFKWGGAVYLNGEIYIFGGHKMEKELYKLETLKWTKLADMNEGRKYITKSCLEWNGSIWVFGGFNISYSKSVRRRNGNWLKSVERYDPEENKWIKMPDMKYPRFDAAAAVDNGKFIVCGGEGSWNNFLKSVECFDPKSGVWTELSDLPSPRHGPSLVSYSNSLILMGGGDGKRYLNSVLELNNLEKGGTWTELPPMNFSRCDFSSALLDNEIFAIGGNHRKGVEIFDGQNWRDGPPLPYVCGRASSIIIPQNLTDALCNYSE